MKMTTVRVTVSVGGVAYAQVSARVSTMLAPYVAEAALVQVREPDLEAAEDALAAEERRDAPRRTRRAAVRRPRARG